MTFALSFLPAEASEEHLIVDLQQPVVVSLAYPHYARSHQQLIDAPFHFYKQIENLPGRHSNSRTDTYLLCCTTITAHHPLSDVCKNIPKTV